MDFEEDDFFAEVFLSVSNADLDSSSVSEENVSKKRKDIEIPGSSILESTSNSDKNDFPLLNTEELLAEISEHCSYGENSSSPNVTLKKKKCPSPESCTKTYLSTNRLSAISNKQHLQHNKQLCLNTTTSPGGTKRKLPGPAGFLSDAIKETSIHLYPPQHSFSSLKKLPANDFHNQDIVSSQLTIEELQIPSWEKMLSDISANMSLKSILDSYNIRNILQESSKKKLPKHLVVPALCVALKSINCNTPSVTAVFKDETGEVTGNISKEVLLNFSNDLHVGAVLLLKKVVFLCNILMLKVQNLVSIYHTTGSVTHLQQWSSILDDCEPEAIVHNKENVMSHYDHLSNEQGSSRGEDFQLDEIALVEKINQKVPNNSIEDITQENDGKDICCGENNKLSAEVFNDMTLENDEDNFPDDFDELLSNIDENSLLGHSI